VLGRGEKEEKHDQRTPDVKEEREGRGGRKWPFTTGARKRNTWEWKIFLGNGP